MWNEKGLKNLRFNLTSEYLINILKSISKCKTLSRVNESLFNALTCANWFLHITDFYCIFFPLKETPERLLFRLLPGGGRGENDMLRERERQHPPLFMFHAHRHTLSAAGVLLLTGRHHYGSPSLRRSSHGGSAGASGLGRRVSAA